jgi:hypothetical protein
MTDRGRSVIRDPAVAIAASKCWLASMMNKAGALPGVPPLDSFHPAECTFCDFDRDGIIQALEEFAAWAGISKDEETPMRAEIERFLTLPGYQQSAFVRRAQGE